MDLVCLLFAWAASAFFAIFQIIKTLMRFLKVRVSKSWPEAVGTITSVEMGESRASIWFHFDYSYAVPGSETVYTGRLKIKKFSGNVPGKDAINKILAAHPVGSTLSVRYNPKKPQQTLDKTFRVITPGLIWSVAIILVMTLLFYLLMQMIVQVLP